MTIEEKFPRNFNIEKEYQEDYRSLERQGIFEEASHLEVFLAAMAVGWKNNQREALDNRYPLVNTDSLENEKAWLVASIAVAEEDIVVLNDFTRVRNIADEYANGGFPILKDKLQSGNKKSTMKSILKEINQSID